MIRVQREPFDVGRELAALKAGNTAIGATAVFVGSVRDHGDGRAVSAMTLEHYPGMTERALAEIEAEARRRWPLLESLIIHRYGRLELGEDIVLVITASSHRGDAFQACEFLMDWLKTRAPFWKLETAAAGGDTVSAWVEARDSDDEAARRWANDNRRD
jgi:molybdopterin synthase catalytic subunit